MAVLSSSDRIIMDHAINSTGHEKILFDGLNTMEIFYLKEQMEPIGK